MSSSLCSRPSFPIFRQEFKEALKAAELGLTRKDINLILSHIDVDRDGLVSYEEFIPVCFQVRIGCTCQLCASWGCAPAREAVHGAGCGRRTLPAAMRLCLCYCLFRISAVCILGLCIETIARERGRAEGIANYRASLHVLLHFLHPRVPCFPGGHAHVVAY